MRSKREILSDRHQSFLPFTFLNVAISADGKIAPGNGNYVPFGSESDKELLLDIRTRADAVMTGARTVEAFPVNLGPGGIKWRKKRMRAGRSAYNLRIIISGSASVDPTSEIFRHKFSPIIVLTTETAPPANLRRLEKAGAILHLSPGGKVDFRLALRWLYQDWKVKKLLCEGGGTVNAGLFEAGLVDEVFLTICPVIIGGRNSPTLSDGTGAASLSDAIPLHLKSKKLVGGELYLRYLVENRKRASG